MPFQNNPRKGGIVPSIGLTPMIKAKSRARRETHSAISEISGTGRERRNDLLPNLRVDMMLIDALKQANRRVRKENPVQRAKVAASLSKFGICQPILVDAQSTIVHGHEVWNAARKLGRTQARPHPCAGHSVLSSLCIGIETAVDCNEQAWRNG